jgi:hypothetical protein
VVKIVNYFGSSKNMESEGFKNSIKELEIKIYCVGSRLCN